MMYNPPHPGEFIKEMCLNPLGLSITQAAQDLGVARKTLSELLNGHSGISSEMALRLAQAFNTTPESWLIQQMQYDLWRAKQKKPKLAVQKLWKKRPLLLNTAVI